MFKRILKWFKKDKPKPLPRRNFKDPTYPPDLAEMFPENRTEDTTDRVVWNEVDIDR